MGQWLRCGKWKDSDWYHDITNDYSRFLFTFSCYTTFESSDHFGCSVSPPTWKVLGTNQAHECIPSLLYVICNIYYSGTKRQLAEASHLDGWRNIPPLICFSMLVISLLTISWTRGHADITPFIVDRAATVNIGYCVSSRTPSNGREPRTPSCKSATLKACIGGPRP